MTNGHAYLIGLWMGVLIGVFVSADVAVWTWWWRSRQARRARQAQLPVARWRHASRADSGGWVITGTRDDLPEEWRQEEADDYWQSLHLRQVRAYTADGWRMFRIEAATYTMGGTVEWTAIDEASYDRKNRVPR